MKYQTALVALLPISVMMFGFNALANFDQAKESKTLLCYGPDNMSITLDSRKTNLTYTIEGESGGPLKITDVKSDKKTFVSYTSAEGTLTLSNQGDTFLWYSDSEPSEVDCGYLN
jgi:hypothetical protein